MLVFKYSLFSLSPVEQEILEDTWKPDDGFIGRKVQSRLYHIKQIHMLCYSVVAIFLFRLSELT